MQNEHRSGTVRNCTVSIGDAVMRPRCAKHKVHARWSAEVHTRFTRCNARWEPLFLGQDQNMSSSLDFRIEKIIMYAHTDLLQYTAPRVRF